MHVRDWLNLLIRLYGLYICVEAIRGGVSALVQFFGLLSFWMTLLALVHAAIEVVIGAVLMSRASDILQFMRVPDGPSAGGPPISPPAA